MEFRDLQHEKAYYELVEQMELSDKEYDNQTLLLKRQLAFVYLISLYQEEYIKYEGEAFYIEVGEELSIGGPTYLFDSQIGARKFAHEIILPIAYQILKGEEPDRSMCPNELVGFLNAAIKMSSDK